MATSQKKEGVLDAGVQIPIVILDDAIIDEYPSTDYLEVRLNDGLRWTDGRSSYHLVNETNIEVKVKVVQSQDLLVAFQSMGNGYGSRGLAEPITIRVADGVRVVI